MKRKQMCWWVALMLPGFFMRSLIPVGFMPMVGPGYGVQLVICDSYAPVPWISTSMPMDMPNDMRTDAGTDMSQHHHADGAANSAGGPPVHQDRGSCPYGSSPALGALPTLTILSLMVQRSSELAIASPQVGYFKVSPLAQSPRGPPA